MTTSTIPIGPFHPLQEEPELFRLHVDGETVVDVDVEIGWNHRGIEKVSEGKTFDQVPFLVERICGICSTSHPIAYVQAVEDAGHLEVPERALYIRSIIAELERLHSHLLWVGLAGHFLGYNTVFMWAWKYREPVLDICEELTGNRNNYAMIKVGGVRRDLDESKFPGVLGRLDELEKKVKMLAGAVTDDPVLHARLKGVGVLTEEAARDYGALGPTVRGSGIPWDVRADEPYAAYDLVDWDIITAPSCDVYGRAVVRVLECFESIEIIRQCFENMPEGDIDANVTEIPPGEGIGHAEAPRGETFHYVRSDGTNQPVRHKARAPTYMNLPTCYETVVGESVTDATIILASVDPCYSCTERMGVVYDASSGERLLDGKELVRLSQEKTEALRREMGR
ncbi:MAG: nickel-dependent hydrogenase large subunit [Candidatus Brocadiia bacterium]